MRDLHLMVLILCAIGLGFTGFPGFIGITPHMGGISLLTPVAMGSIFLLAVVFSGFFYAERCRFSGVVRSKRFLRPTRLFFWILLISAVIASTSVLLAMFPLFGTDVQVVLLQIHRYSSVFLFLSALFFGGTLLPQSEQQ